MLLEIIIIFFISLVCNAQDSAVGKRINLYTASINAVLFNIHLDSMSGLWRKYFSDKTKFRLILDTVLGEA